MASSVAVVQPVSESFLKRFVDLIPGVLLLVAVGYAGKIIERSINQYGKAHHLTLPNIEYVLWAIVIGLVIANTVGIPRIFQAGIATYEFWLKAGIVLLGSRFLLGDVAKLGGISLVLVVIEIALSLVFMTWLGRAFGLSPKLTTLLAVGSSICGVSAIIAAKGAIDADDEDASYAIAAILSLGAISLFIFPLIGHWLHLGDQSYGLWAGLGIDNTAEATAAGALYSDAAGKVAVLAKTARNAMIGFVVLGYAIHWARKEGTEEVGNKAAVDFRHRHRAGFQQGPTRQSRQSFALGLPAHLRRGRPSHQYPRARQAGLPPLHRRRSRRSRNRLPDAWPGVRGRQNLAVMPQTPRPCFVTQN
jgi:uncharacterized integral membrane protein (TIGR00698 family)